MSRILIIFLVLLVIWYRKSPGEECPGEKESS
jgi:hypothetical protein